MNVLKIFAGLSGLAVFAAISMNVPMTPTIYLLAIVVIGAPSMTMIVSGAARLIAKRPPPQAAPE